MTDGGQTRRQFLALVGAAAGTAALAGCSRLESEPPSIRGGALDEAVSGPVPELPETIPVDVDAARLDGTAADIRERLEGVPAPFAAAEVPNGAIREELSGRLADARTSLDDAASATSDRAAMDDLRSASADAAFVEAGWSAIDAGQTRADVRSAVPDIRDDLAEFRRRWRYVGESPVRAVVVHEAIEQLVASTVRSLNRVLRPFEDRRETPVAVGELAAGVEAARASLADGEYLFDRLEASLSAPRSLVGGFERSGRELAASVERRRSELPDGDPDDPSSLVDADVDVAGTPAGQALTELYRVVSRADRTGELLDDGRLPGAIVVAHDTLARARAFERLRGRIEAGEFATVETADDVRSIRVDAVSAVEDAAAADAHPTLDRTTLSWVDRAIARSDHELRGLDADREIPVTRLEREVGRYVLAREVAAATPPTSDAVAAVLRG